MADSKDKIFPGGAFLVKESQPEEVFTPEDFDDEQKMILDMCLSFIKTHVTPHLDDIDAQKPGLMEDLLEKSGEQGLLGAAFPEEYNGLDKDFITATLINEGLGAGHSYSVAMAAHTGIGSLPLLYFGTKEQKEKWLPRLATGELKASYALSEADSGSDALSARTSATLSKDGKYYLLNGQKSWITNSGFADLFTVFAKIDGTEFTAFLVEKGTEGFTLGKEEDKMGIKGSSTRQLFFENAKVPVENVLGEKGKGHKIAFNILNIGRLKLAAAATGGAKSVIKLSAKYAKDRKQFNTAIAHFGAIQYKLAEQHIRTFAIESALYRTSAYIDHVEKELLEEGTPFNEAALRSAEEYAIECAILKVAGSEAADFVIDEGVQIHGGNGFIIEYEVSRAYRDSRINRIFEGTNEINRLLIPGMLLKRAMKGRVELMEPAMAVQKELMAIPDFSESPETEDFAAEIKQIQQLKKAILMVAGAGVQKLEAKLEQEQEILMNVADMLIELYEVESVLLRVKKHPDIKNGKEILRVLLVDVIDRFAHYGRNAINGFSDGDEQRMLLMGLKRFLKHRPSLKTYDTVQARRKIAQDVLASV